MSCPCGIDGTDEHLPDTSGNDTLRALMLAARLLSLRLSDFKDKGARVVYPGTNDEVDLEAVLHQVGGIAYRRGGADVLQDRHLEHGMRAATLWLPEGPRLSVGVSSGRPPPGHRPGSKRP